MPFPTITATYAALLSIVLAGLSAWVVAGRGQFKVHHGDGGNDRLQRRIRAHGNFVEYVPLILLLCGLLEAHRESPWTMHGLLGTLLLARLVHPVGMLAPIASAQQYVLRGTTAFATWLVLITVSALLLLRAGG